MKYLSEKDIVEKILKRELFEATIESGAFTLKIDNYEPSLSVAIHNGGEFSDVLSEQCLLSKEERYYEEDPYTGSFIEKQGITVTVHDSRYAYDLNRRPDECIYKSAWGKEVWRSPLDGATIAVLREKHACFHRVITCILDALTEDFGQCLVYDVHSYNYRRYERTDLPLFNLGTVTVTKNSWRPVILNMLAELQKIQLVEIPTTAVENDIFSGKGYLAVSVHKRFENVLVLAIEVKKVFMDERTGEADNEVLSQLQQQFNATLLAVTKSYIAETG
ncbi:MAG: hypothetical protein DSY80_01720 [Desulfocapsa sp.]|nr:MAG: hypothetical protein DSY80_01720 [Desulfocapsa sp.]